jgi:ATP-binding cassette subfamily B protein
MATHVPIRRTVATAGRVIWRAAPGLTIAYALVTAVGALLPVAAALLTRLTLDRLVSGAPAVDVVALGAGVAAAGLGIVLEQTILRYLIGEVGRRVSRWSLHELYEATDRFVGLGPFESPALSDRLQLAKVASNSAGQTVADVSGLFGGAITLVGFVAALASISPLATVIVVAAAVPSLYAELRLSRQRARMTQKITPHIRREIFYLHLLDDPDAAKEIRLFGLGLFMRGRMLAERSVADRSRRRMDLRDARYQGFLGLLSAGIAGAGLIWAVLAARRGVLTIGDVALFATTVAGVQAAVTVLVAGIAAVQSRLLALAHYAAVVDGEPDLPVRAEPVAVPGLRTGIELRDVWFRYSEDHPWVLRGVNLTLPAGRAVALVGLNGAGKSTLVKLLCRLYDPTRGAILWDGVDIRDMAPADLRAHISAVFQDHMTYEMTAAENIGMADLSALSNEGDDTGKIRAAAERAGVHDLVANLPNGYDTMLTRIYTSSADIDDAETGVVLSGGQWQRLALARAFMRPDPDLMILDEPSSGLDPEAEHDIHHRMQQYREGRTSLLVSHRFNAIRDADVIAVLDNGTIVERGDHDALMHADGAYARLFRLQAAGYQTQDYQEVG